MNSIQDEWVALDTNEFIFALRKDINYPNCRLLIFEKLVQLKVYMPLQVLLELQRNLTMNEMRDVFIALSKAKEIQWDYALAQIDLIAQWQVQGAKKGDAVIIAHLQAANIPYLVSENRHFVVELPELPFKVLTSEVVMNALEGSS
jgi:predicted nucleic acid-binding protein